MGNLCGKQPKEEEDSIPKPRILPCCHSEAVLGLVSAGDGLVLSGGNDKTVQLWDWTCGTILERWTGHTSSVNRVAYTPQHARYITASRDTTVKIWQGGSPAAVQELAGHSLNVSGLSLSYQHQHAWTGSRDYTVRVWDLNTAQQVRMNKISRNVVTCMAAFPSEPAFLQTSEDLQVRVWDSRDLSVAQSFTGHVNIPLSCDVALDGIHMLTCSHGFDGFGCEARLWDRRKGAALHVFEGHTESANACCFLQGKTGGG
ncbi:hypothetical protein CYMTET_10206, partial [Cymbomonas tetramitiformis]